MPVLWPHAESGTSLPKGCILTSQTSTRKWQTQDGIPLEWLATEDLVGSRAKAVERHHALANWDGRPRKQPPPEVTVRWQSTGPGPRGRLRQRTSSRGSDPLCLQYQQQNNTFLLEMSSPIIIADRRVHIAIGQNRSVLPRHGVSLVRNLAFSRRSKPRQCQQLRRTL